MEAHLTEQVDFQKGSSKPGILFDTTAVASSQLKLDTPEFAFLQVQSNKQMPVPTLQPSLFF